MTPSKKCRKNAETPRKMEAAYSTRNAQASGSTPLVGSMNFKGFRDLVKNPFFIALPKIVSN